MMYAQFEERYNYRLLWKSTTCWCRYIPGKLQLCLEFMAYWIFKKKMFDLNVIPLDLIII